MRPLAIVCVLILAGLARADDRPNVLVILTDDHRHDAMGCAGHPFFKTPHLDRLAAEGARFVNAFVTTSLCSPSRASLLSGRYSHGHTVLDNFTDYPNDLPSYPRRLQEAGYETAYVGKWHMGEQKDDPRPGFDFWLSHKGQGNYWDNEFNRNGTREVRKGYYTTVVTDAALDWLKQRREKPFCLILGHKAPHGGPIVPEPRYEKFLDAETIEKPKNWNATEGGKPAWLKQSVPTWHGLDGPLYNIKDYGKFVRSYLGTIASVDDSVGRLYAHLKESGQLDKTLVIYVSDNGFALGEHGQVDKRTMYEESIRVPLIVRYPKLAKAGSKIEPMVLNLDLAPSILDVCGAKPLEGAHGRSWKPLLEGKADGWRTAWFYRYDYEKEFPYTPNVRGVRTARWKYIRYPHGDGQPDRHLAELYDLEADPLEVRNLAADPKYADQVKAMRAELERVMKDAGALPDKLRLDEGIKNVLPRF